MPLYEYHCEACGERFELIRKFSDPPLDVCDKCGKGPVTRLQSSPAIQFKGTGWYITDYAKKGTTASTSTDTASNAPSTTASADKPAAGSDSSKTDSGKTAAPAAPAAATGSKD